MRQTHPQPGFSYVPQSKIITDFQSKLYLIDTEKSLKCICFCFVRKLIAVENFVIAIFKACFCFSLGVEKFGQLNCLSCLNEKWHLSKTFYTTIYIEILN